MNACLCGCGTDVKNNYKAGHDASHVSRLLAEIVASGDLSQANAAKYIKTLPSPALQAKLQRAVDNYSAPKPTRAPRRRGEWVDSDIETYKVGRWTYPVQEYIKNTSTGEYPTGKMRYNEKRDGSGEWINITSEFGGEFVAL